MAKAKIDYPNLGNATVGFLIDEIGRMREEQNTLKALLKYFESSLESKVDISKVNTALAGEHKYNMSVTPVSQVRLNTEKAQELLAKYVPQEVLDAAETRPWTYLEFYQKRFHPKPQELQQALGPAIEEKPAPPTLIPAVPVPAEKQD